MGYRHREEVLRQLELEAMEGRRRNVERGTVLPFDAFCALTGMSTAELNQALDARRIFEVDVDGEYYVPAFLARANLAPESWAPVIRILEHRPPWAMATFFVNGKGSLGGITPLEALARGEVEAVKRAARGYVEG